MATAEARTYSKPHTRRYYTKPLPGKGSHGFYNYGPHGQPRNVHAMGWEKLTYLATHDRTDPELRDRCVAELLARLEQESK